MDFEVEVLGVECATASSAPWRTYPTGSSELCVVTAALANEGSSTAVAPPPSTNVNATPTASFFIPLLLFVVIVLAFLLRYSTAPCGRSTFPTALGRCRSDFGTTTHAQAQAKTRRRTRRACGQCNQRPPEPAYFRWGSC